MLAERTDRGNYQRTARAPVEAPAQEPAPSLSPGEHSAFEELARELNARLKGAPGQRTCAELATTTTSATISRRAAAATAGAPNRAAPNPRASALTAARSSTALPIGILVYRLNNLIYANRAFLDWTGYDSLQTLAEAGGLDSLFIETSRTPDGKDDGVKPGQVADHRHRQRQAEAGRRPPVQRAVERRERAGADDQHPRRVRRPHQGDRNTRCAAPRGKPRTARHSRHRHRRRAGARPRRPRAVGQSQRARRCSATTPPISPN